MSTKEYNVSGFNRVQIKFAMDVDVFRSDAYNVSITGNETQLNNINVSQEAERLTISYNINLRSVLAAPFARMHAKIALPDLREFNLSGAAYGTIRSFNLSNDFALHVSGASHLDISDMTVSDMRWDLSGASWIKGEIKADGNFNLKISGASHIDLKGSAGDIDVDASGASHLDLEDFSAGNAKVRLAGASRSTVNTTGKLDVRLDGASRLEYIGQPTMGEIQVTGASSLKRK